MLSSAYRQASTDDCLQALAWGKLLNVNANQANFLKCRSLLAWSSQAQVYFKIEELHIVSISLSSSLQGNYFQTCDWLLRVSL